MLQTPLCTLLGIEFPIIQAGMGVFTSAELAAAVSNAGGLGSVGTFLRPVEDLPRQLARLRELTSRPFAINHLVPALDEGAFAHTLAARPPVIVLALGDPGDLVQRAHGLGSLGSPLVTTVPQACEAAARGVDVIIAQGGEAGGYGGTIATFTLLPQVVDAVRPLPVVAAGGIADGRGLAAALVLGAAGVNIGTRFLASVEAPIPLGWKHRIVEAEAQDTVKVEVWNDISPVPGSRGVWYRHPRPTHAVHRHLATPARRGQTRGGPPAGGGAGGPPAGADPRAAALCRRERRVGARHRPGRRDRAAAGGRGPAHPGALPDAPDIARQGHGAKRS
jgi:enoyl-[acyl-carrier protein] reductase II